MSETSIDSVDIRDKVCAKLKDMERNLMWLSRKIEVPYGTLYSILVQKTTNISTDKLKSINEVLGTDFKQS